MSVLNHTTKLLWGCCFAIVPNQSVWGNSADQRSASPVSTASCERTVDAEIEPQIDAPIIDAEVPVSDGISETIIVPPVDAKPQKATPSFEIGLPMFMDSRYLGDVTVRVIGDVVKVEGALMIQPYSRWT